MIFRILVISALTLTIFFSAEAGKSIQPEPENEMLGRIRNEFYQAVENEDALNSLTHFIEGTFSTDPAKYPAVILAYYGALESVRAKHTYNPYSKFKHVTAGLKKLDKAVDMMPDKLEIRFLRFAVLHNIPGIFGVADERNADLKVSYEQLLRQDYSSLGRKLQKGIAEFLMRSGRLEPAETEKLKKIFPDAQTE